MSEHGVAQIWRRIRSIYNVQGNKCETCETYFFPPRPVCPTCRRKGKLMDYVFKGLGSIYSFTVVRQAPDDFKRQMPYVIAQVELDELPLLGTFVEIEGPDEKTIHQVQQRIGLSEHRHIEASYLSLLSDFCRRTGSSSRRV